MTRRRRESTPDAGPDEAGTHVRFDFRIETRRPGRRTWEYLPFAGASARTHEDIDRALAYAEADAEPGWKFRIRRRTVRTEYGEWEDA